MSSERELHAAASRAAAALQRRQLKIVLAESCTGGLVAAALTAIPGISAHLCGSLVVYRNGSKISWLGISRGLVTHAGSVSSETTLALAKAALQKTAEADLSAAVTGHLGPDAAEDQDGVVFVALAFRKRSQWRNTRVREGRFQLALDEPYGRRPRQRVRRNRQRRASILVLEEISRALEEI